MTHGISLKKRRIIMVLCIVVFFALIPPIFYFVTGYRLGQNWSFVETGGLYIGADKSGSEIYVNGTLEKTTNILQGGVFLQGLKPKKYNIVVAKDGYWTWSKDLVVKAHLVSEARSFNLRKEPKGRILKPEDVSALGFSEYDDALNLFNLQKPATKKATTTVSSKKDLAVATTTEIFSKNNKQKIYIEGNNKIWAEWLGEEKEIPYYFCDQENKCSDKILVLNSKTPVKKIDFFIGRKDVIIYATANGVFVTEIDGRSGRVTQPLYKGKNPNFSWPQAGSGLYILDDNRLIKIDEI